MTPDDALCALAKLEANWDGYGGPPIKHGAIAQARWFYERHCLRMPYPDVVPLSNGGVQLEWHNGNRSVEIEFSGDNEVSWLVDLNVEDGSTSSIYDDRAMRHLAADVGLVFRKEDGDAEE